MATVQLGEYRAVTIFAPEDKDLKIPLEAEGSHRAHHGEAVRPRRDYSIHDPEGGVTYHASYSDYEGIPLDEYVNPRHHHAFAQLRFRITGEDEYSRTAIKPGWLGYFPEGVYYGPHKTVKAGRGIVLQFPGPSGGPFHSRTQTQIARKKVRAAGGRFEDGLCVWPDGKKQDAHEALMEALYEKKAEYPDPVFGSQIWFDTNNIEWHPTDTPGVSVKRLACFEQEGPAIQLIKLEPGASTPAGRTGSFMIRYIYEGEGDYGDKHCEAVTNMYYPPDAPYEGIFSKTGATILSIELQSRLEGSEPPLPYRI